MAHRTCSAPGCRRAHHARGFCSAHAGRLYRGTDPNRPLRTRYAGKTCEERFRLRVNLDGPVPDYAPELGPCHIWTGAILGTGYGALRCDGRTVRAHTFGWQIEHGPVPDGLELDHLCRVRPCVRNSHLEPVTRAENLRRGRVARGVGPKPCSIDGCQTTAHCRGWCPMHYQRWRKYGSPAPYVRGTYTRSRAPR